MASCDHFMTQGTAHNKTQITLVESKHSVLFILHLNVHVLIRCSDPAPFPHLPRITSQELMDNE